MAADPVPARWTELARGGHSPGPQTIYGNAVLSNPAGTITIQTGFKVIHHVDMEYRQAAAGTLLPL